MRGSVWVGCFCVWVRDSVWAISCNAQPIGLCAIEYSSDLRVGVRDQPCVQEAESRASERSIRDLIFFRDPRLLFLLLHPRLLVRSELGLGELWQERPQEGGRVAAFGLSLFALRVGKRIPYHRFFLLVLEKTDHERIGRSCGVLLFGAAWEERRRRFFFALRLGEEGHNLEQLKSRRIESA